MIASETGEQTKRPRGRPKGRKVYDPMIGVRFPRPLIHAVKDVAIREETTLAAVVREAVLQYLDRQGEAEAA